MAYKKLSTFLGEEVMTKAERIDCPIIIDPNLPIADAKVTWAQADFKVQKNGEPMIMTPPQVGGLYIKNVTEAILAHELVHLYAQPAGFWSEAFHEGQAQAIQNILYPTNDPLHTILSDSRIVDLMNEGMDFNVHDHDALGRGVQNQELYRLCYHRWGMDWEELHKSNPTFLRDFYTEIARQRKNGKNNFSSTELNAIAQHVLPSFATFKSMQELGKKEVQKSKAMKFLLPSGEATLVIANYKTEPRIIGDKNMTPPFIKPLFEGVIRIQYIDTLTREEKTYSPSVQQTDFIIIPLPKDIAHTTDLRVFIGDHEIPFS